MRLVQRQLTLGNRSVLCAAVAFKLFMSNMPQSIIYPLEIHWIVRSKISLESEQWLGKWVLDIVSLTVISGDGGLSMSNLVNARYQTYAQCLT